MARTITLSRLTVIKIEINVQEQYLQVHYALGDDARTVKVAGLATFWRVWPTDPGGQPLPAQDDWYQLTAQEGNGLVTLVQRVRQALLDRLINA